MWLHLHCSQHQTRSGTYTALLFSLLGRTSYIALAWQQRELRNIARPMEYRVNTIFSATKLIYFGIDLVWLFFSTLHLSLAFQRRGGIDEDERAEEGYLVGWAGIEGTKEQKSRLLKLPGWVTKPLSSKNPLPETLDAACKQEEGMGSPQTFWNWGSRLVLQTWPWHLEFAVDSPQHFSPRKIPPLILITQSLQTRWTGAVSCVCLSQPLSFLAPNTFPQYTTARHPRKTERNSGAKLLRLSSGPNEPLWRTDKWANLCTPYTPRAHT